jgi:hypothetical protein
MSRNTETIILTFLLVLNLFLVLVIVSPRISGFFTFNRNVEGPGDFVKEEMIYANGSSVTIAIKNPMLFRYDDSGSMQPVLGASVNGVGFKPLSPAQIHVGDIINFQSNGLFIVHRVVEKGQDEQGVYFITRGDNSDVADSKIRFEDIDGVVVALIY